MGKKLLSALVIISPDLFFKLYFAKKHPIFKDENRENCSS